MTIVKTLKALYERLGGTPSDVANATRAVDVLNAIAALYGGASNATRITKAIANIAAVASGLIKPSGTKSIAENGSGIDVTEYAAVNVNVPQPSGTISITENGNGIDVTQYASANVNVETFETVLKNLINRDITEIVIPSRTSDIGQSAFSSCTQLTRVEFEDPTEIKNSIGMDAFRSCYSLTELDLRGFNQVYFNAFLSSGITTLYFSTDLTEFVNGGSGETVFDGATNLTDIYYTGTQVQWEAITGLSGAGIPAGCTVHYEYTPS